MYTIYSQDTTVYLEPHFMDGYIKIKKKEVYLHITTSYRQHVKNEALSGTNSSNDYSSDGEYHHGDPLPPLTEDEITTEHRKDSIQLFLISKALKKFVDIFTMNTSHHTKFKHAYVLDVHFSKSTIESDVTAAPAKRQMV